MSKIDLRSFVSPLLSADVAPDMVLPAGRRFPAAVLFADITGFTALTERLDGSVPGGVEELTRVINACFEPVVNCVLDAGGDIVKFAGDAVLAIWPAEQEPLATAALRAAACALEVQEAIGEVDRREQDPLAIKVALGVGEVLLAHLGGVYDRREVLIAGLALRQVGVGNDLCGSGEIVVSLETANLLYKSLRLELNGRGAPRLVAVTSPPPVAAAAAAPVEVSQGLLRPYIPNAMLTRLETAHAGWVAELRRITVLFVNLPELDEHTRPSSAQDLMVAMQTCIYRFEGSLNKLSVDDKGVSLVAVYGLPPVAHEDDPERGVRAALAVSELLSGKGLSHSVGVTSGRAFCGIVGGERRREYTIIGGVVNLAARLMKAAGNGGILCDEATRQAAARRCTFSQPQDYHLKGLPEPVPGYRPTIGISADVSGDAHRCATVGRREERQTIQAALQGLCTPAPGVRMLTIEGPAGIGKSQLVADLLDGAKAAGHTLLVGLADPLERRSPYHPWRSICRQLLGKDELQPDATVRRTSLISALGDDEVATTFHPLLQQILPLGLGDNAVTGAMDSQARAENTRLMLGRLIARATAKAPAVLVFEDCQWFDSTSAQALQFILRTVPRLLIVVAMRTQSRMAEVWESVLATPFAQRLILGRLQDDDLVQILCRRLGVDGLPAPFSELLAAKAQGNPLYAEELTLALRERGILLVESRECRLAPGLSDLQDVDLPESIEGIVISRVDRLQASEQLVMKTASVIGQQFTVRLVHDMFPLQGGRKRVAEHLRRLEEARFAVRCDSGEEPAYAFAESVTRDIVYNMMSHGQRRELHRLAAENLEQTNEAASEVTSSLLAHHWDSAGDVVKARHYMAGCGEAALHSHASREAVHFLERACKLAEERPAASAFRMSAWERQLGLAHFQMGDPVLSEPHLHRSLAIDGYSVPRQRIRMALSLFGQLVVQVAHRVLGTRRTRSPEVRERLLAAALAFQYLGNIHFFSQNALAGIHAVVHCLNLSERAGPSPLLAEACGQWAVACAVMPLPRAARFYADKALELAMGEGMESKRPFVLQATAAALGSIGDLKEARRLLPEGAEQARQLGDGRRFEECTSVLGSVVSFFGEHEESQRLYTVVEAAGRHRGDPQTQLWGLLGLSRAALAMGDLEASAAMLRQGLELEAKGFVRMDPGSRLQLHAIPALLALHRQEFDTARRHATQLLEQLASHRPTTFYSLLVFRAAPEVFVSLLESGRGSASQTQPLAKTALEMMRRFASIFPLGQPDACALQSRLAAALGSSERALKWRERAAAAAARLGIPVPPTGGRDCPPQKTVGDAEGRGTDNKDGV